MTTRPPRAELAQAGAAVRVSIERALAADPPPGASRVLLAIVAQVGTWTRLEDQRHRSQLAAMAGLSERQCSRALAWLVDVGAVEWKAGRRNVPSRVAFLSSETERECAVDIAFADDTAGHLSVLLTEDHSGTPECPTEIHSGTSTAPQRDISSATAGHLDGSPHEDVHENVHEEGRAEAFDDLDDLAAADPPHLPMSDPTPEHEAEFAEVLAAFTATEGPDRAHAAVDSLGRIKVRYASDFRKALERWAREHPDRAAVAPIDLQAAALRRTADRNARRDRGDTCPDCLDSGLVLDDHDTAHRCACQAAPA